MAIQARVTSTEALASFRASLIVFQGKARRVVDDVSDEVRRTRMWLQHEKRIEWEGELRRRTKVLQQMQQELMSSQLTDHQETAVLVRKAAVNKAKRALTDAEEKLRNLKKWVQNYDSAVDPRVKKLESLRQYLVDDLPKALAYLYIAQKTLEEYAMAEAPASGAAPAPATPDEPEQQP